MNQIDLQPIPFDAQISVRQAHYIQAKVDKAGSIAAALEAAVDAIYATNPTDDPSEIKRLRRLYLQAYTRPELASLVKNTFSRLAIREPV